MEKVIENNQVTVLGKIASEFSFSHEVYGEGFYLADLQIERNSGVCDKIPVMVSDRLIDVTQDYTGRTAFITGQFLSYNQYHEQEKKSKVLLSVFAREFSFSEEDVNGSENNFILLDGYLCKAPHYRKTPLGREIADLILAVNRPYGKSDYIPCICWGRNARFASGLEVGCHIQVLGRIQSREYQKRLPDGSFEDDVRTAYEVSVSRIILNKN